MELSPKLYNLFVRPNWYNKKFMINVLKRKKYIFRNKKVLDFGCGIGSNSFLFEPKNYLGVDIDKQRIKYAKKNNPGYRFKILKKDIYNSSEKYFDIILIVAVLHHIPDSTISSIFKKFERILKYPSGEIIVLEPCFFKENLISNYYMKLLDRGKYIRKQDEYLSIFKNHKYQINFIKKIQKLAYRELLLSASRK